MENENKEVKAPINNGAEQKFSNNNRNDRERRFNNDRRNVEKSPYTDKVISISRIVKVNKGGRQMRFSATVVVGDGKGKVGIGQGKSKEVPEAVSKAIKAAEKNIIKINLVDNRTISHEVTGVCGAAKILMRPARPGRGIIAGGATRAILDLAGVKDVVAKSLGSNTQINTARATMDALMRQKSAEHIAKLRGKTVEELLK